jgi:hypothetical protein
MDGLVERGDVCENLVGEVTALRSRQAGSISLSSGAYFGSHSTVSQCVRAAKAASEEISGAASRKSRECRAILRRGKSRLDARTPWWWTQSCETCLHRPIPWIQGKNREFRSKTTKLGTPCDDLRRKINSLRDEFPTRPNRELNTPNRQRIPEIRDRPCSGWELSNASLHKRLLLLVCFSRRRA